MFLDNQIWIGDSDGEHVSILPKMANRHGLIAGATGTGKTVTLKVLAESFSDAGVPVFLADVKGDLAGMCLPGEASENMNERIKRFGLDQCGFRYEANPTTFWDIYQEMGIPLRSTISEMGPILLAKLMNLNATQTDVLTVLFRIADDNNLLLIDTKDLKAMVQYASDHNEELSREYGALAKQSLTAILRHIVALDSVGGDKFFGEPNLELSDWLKTVDGKGMINILDSTKLIQNPTMYGVFLLWLMSELFEALPEVGDPELPTMVFFFDEAHLLFADATKVLKDKIEQTVKLIRSKGVGIYFITQNPKDLPDGVLNQLGNKIQHALRAYTPADEKAIKAAADSFRPNPAFDTKTVIQELGVGEALISVLDEKGVPSIVKKCKILPPHSQMGPISENTRSIEIKYSKMFAKYFEAVDNQSAYEDLNEISAEEKAEKERIAEEERIAKEEAKAAADAEKKAAAEAARAEKEAIREEERRAREEARAQAAAEKKAQQEAERKKKAVNSGVTSVAKTAGGTIGREVGNAVGKTIGGSFGKKLGGNLGAALGRNFLGILFKRK